MGKPVSPEESRVMKCPMQFLFRVMVTLLAQVLTCPSQTLLPHRSTFQCLLAPAVNTTTSLSQKPLGIKNTTAVSSSSKQRMRRSTRSNRTSRNTTSTRNITIRRITRVGKKTTPQLLLENLPLPETLPPLEMMMTAGRQARTNLRHFGNLGKAHSREDSDKKYVMFWLTTSKGK